MQLREYEGMVRGMRRPTGRTGGAAPTGGAAARRGPGVRGCRRRAARRAVRRLFLLTGSAAAARRRTRLSVRTARRAARAVFAGEVAPREPRPRGAGGRRARRAGRRPMWPRARCTAPVPELLRLARRFRRRMLTSPAGPPAASRVSRNRRRTARRAARRRLREHQVRVGPPPHQSEQRLHVRRSAAASAGPSLVLPQLHRHRGREAEPLGEQLLGEFRQPVSTGVSRFLTASRTARGTMLWTTAGET